MKLEKKRISQLKKIAWDYLSKLMRLNFPYCEICNRKPSTQTHHIIGRRKGNVVFLNEDNLIAVCNGCHIDWHSRMSPVEKIAIIQKTRRDAYYDNVEACKNDTVKFTRSMLLSKIQDYKDRIRNIEK